MRSDDFLKMSGDAILKVKNTTKKDMDKYLEICDNQVNLFRKIFYAEYQELVTEDLSFLKITALTTFIENIRTCDILKFVSENLKILPLEINEWQDVEQFVSAGISSNEKIQKYADELVYIVEKIESSFNEFSSLPSIKELQAIYKFFIIFCQILKQNQKQE